MFRFSFCFLSQTSSLGLGMLVCSDLMISHLIVALTGHYKSGSMLYTVTPPQTKASPMWPITATSCFLLRQLQLSDVAVRAIVPHTHKHTHSGIVEVDGPWALFGQFSFQRWSVLPQRKAKKCFFLDLDSTCTKQRLSGKLCPCAWFPVHLGRPASPDGHQRFSVCLATSLCAFADTLFGTHEEQRTKCSMSTHMDNTVKKSEKDIILKLYR